MWEVCETIRKVMDPKEQLSSSKSSHNITQTSLLSAWQDVPMMAIWGKVVVAPCFIFSRENCNWQMNTLCQFHHYEVVAQQNEQIPCRHSWATPNCLQVASNSCSVVISALAKHSMQKQSRKNSSPLTWIKSWLTFQKGQDDPPWGFNVRIGCSFNVWRVTIGKESRGEDQFQWHLPS